MKIYKLPRLCSQMRENHCYCLSLSLSHGPCIYPSDFLIYTNLIALLWKKAKYCFATVVAAPNLLIPKLAMLTLSVHYEPFKAINLKTAVEFLCKRLFIVLFGIRSKYKYIISVNRVQVLLVMLHCLQSQTWPIPLLHVHKALQ